MASILLSQGVGSCCWVKVQQTMIIRTPRTHVFLLFIRRGHRSGLQWGSMRLVGVCLDPLLSSCILRWDGNHALRCGARRSRRSAFISHLYLNFPSALTMRLAGPLKPCMRVGSNGPRSSIHLIVFVCDPALKTWYFQCHLPFRRTSAPHPRGAEVAEDSVSVLLRRSTL